MTRKNPTGKDTPRGASDLLEYWQTRVGDYLRKKRAESGYGQKSMSGLSRRAVSDLENGKTNFSLDTLLKALQAVDGDVSEAFHSRIPKKFHTSSQAWHEMLEEVLESTDDHEIRLIQRILTDAVASVRRLKGP